MELRWSHPFGFVVARPAPGDAGPRMLTMVERGARSQKGQDAEAIAALGRAAVRLGCEQILPAEDVRLSNGGRIIVESRLPDGRPLGQLEAALPISDAVGVLRQVLRALSVAHEGGVMHGALSAYSVIVGSDRHRTTVVTDFGLGRLDQTAASGEAVPCSPEKLLGIESGPAEDVYLFGCIAFRALTGRFPFVGDDVEELRRRHAIEDAPDIANLVSVRQLPPSICAVVMRCLAKEPEDRFADAASLEIAWCEAQVADQVGSDWDRLALPSMPGEQKVALRAGLDAMHAEPVVASSRAETVDAPVATLPPAPELPAVPMASPPPPSRGGRGGIWAAAIALVAVFGGGGYAVLSGQLGPMLADAAETREPSEAEASVAEPNEASDEGDEELAPSDAAADEPSAPPIAAVAADDVVVVEDDDEPDDDDDREGAQSDDDDDDRDDGNRHRAKINDLMRQAKQAVANGQKSDAESLYRQVLSMDRNHHRANKRLGELLFSSGNMSGAAKYLRRATATAPRNASLRIQLGDAYFKLGEYSKANKEFERAKKYGHPSAERRLELVAAKLGN